MPDRRLWMLPLLGAAMLSVGCAQEVTVEEAFHSPSNIWQWGTRMGGDYWGTAPDAWLLSYLRTDAKTGNFIFIAFFETVGSAGSEYQPGDRFCHQELEVDFSEVPGIPPDRRMQEVDHMVFDDCVGGEFADVTWLDESSTPGHLTEDTVITSWVQVDSPTELAPSLAWWEDPNAIADKAFPCAPEDQIPGTRINDPDFSGWGGWCQWTTPDWYQ